MKKATYNFSQSRPLDNHFSPRDSNLLQENLKGMDIGLAKNKDLATGSDDGLESSIMDIQHSSSNDIYSTTNSDTLIENLRKLQPDLHNLKERHERPRTGSERNRDEYGVPEQKIRPFHIAIPKLKEENEIPQNMRIGESDQRINSQEHSTRSQTVGYNDLESQIDSKLMRKEFAESTDVFQKKNFSIEAELQDEIRKGQKFQRAIEDLQKKLICLEEENMVLKTVLHSPLKNSDGVKRLIYDIENNGWGGTSNLLVENEDLRNDDSRKSDSMQEHITLLQQELQAKTELAEIQQKQVGDLLQALVKGNCENARLTSEHNRFMEEHGDANTLQAELERAQEVKQKLQKELSAKLNDLKNLHIMFSTLGREKEIMAAELVRKARKLGDMEEDLNDLKEQNRTLSNKLESYATKNKTKNRDIQDAIALVQNRNKLLAEQVLKTSEEYRSVKRKSKDLHEENSGFKREMANLKTSILKQEKLTPVLESERATVVNEITWGKRQLHFMLKNCECFQKETESFAEQQLTKPDSQESLTEEIVFLEQLLLHFKEEIAGIKAESDRGVKEHKKLKEQMAMLQNDLLCLRDENSVFTREKKLDENRACSIKRQEDENRAGSIKRQEDAPDVLFCKQENLQAEVTDINMEKSKFKLDDARDLRNQPQLNEMCMPQKQEDAVFSPKMAPGSEARPPMNQTMKFHVVYDLQK